MPKIDLAIWRGYHAPALDLGHRISAIRLRASVSVLTESGWSVFHRAVIDTGAPISVFPPAIWKHARHASLGRVRIGGLARREACQIPAILAEVDCALSDGQRSLGPLRMHAYLAEVENTPALIGILGFIENGVLRVDLSNNRAALRMP